MELAMETFGAVASRWHADNIRKWSAPVAARIARHFAEDCGPLLDRTVDTITAQQILHIVKQKERTGPDMARRLLGYISRVLDYAVAYGYREYNPGRSLHVALMPRQHGAFAAIHPNRMPEFLAAVEKHTPAPTATKTAFWLLAYTAVRRSEAVYATWPEIDLETKTWAIPAARMKMRRDHIVPLANQVATLLKNWKELCPKSESQWLFPGRWKRMPDRPIDPWGPLYLIRNAGFGGVMTVHGLRKVFSTVAHEAGCWEIDVIETQLAHKIPGVRGIYNHATYLQRRRELMQWYADTIDHWKAAS